MNRLLKFEFRKLFRQKSFYICGAILVGLLLFMSAALYAAEGFSMASTDGGISVEVDENAGFGFNGLEMLVSSLANSSFSVVLAVFLALFICNDHTNDTLKNIIARGYSRLSIYASKFMVSLAAATIYVACCWLCSFLSGTFFWGVGTLDNGSAADFIAVLAAQLLLIYAYTAVFFFLSVLLRKNASSISMCILGPMVLELVLNILDMVFKDKSFYFVDYWLDSILINISAASVPSDILTRSVICSVLYLAVFGICGHLIGRTHQV